MKKILVLISAVALLSLGCTKPPEDKAPLNMVLVDAGPFFMGASGDIEDDNFYEFGLIKPFYADALPMREVTLDAYYIDKYETSNAEYMEFLKATNARRPPHWKDGIYPEGKGKYPMGGVPWAAAFEYCKWMGKRLPTEAEWEKGARGTDKREFPWGNEYDESKLNVAKEAERYDRAAEVDSFPEGVRPYGAYNMSGNVWEWTDSWYKPYPGAVYESDSFGEKSKVVRGNSVSPIAHFPPKVHTEIVAWYARAYFRFPVRPKAYFADIGFRCVKSPEN